ncbi:MAG: family 16 glycoside hydrolase [Alistipes onderdonkii]
MARRRAGDPHDGPGRNGGPYAPGSRRLRQLPPYGEALTQPGAQAALLFHTDGESGYEVVFRNGAIDGTRKSGSLASVRNLYRSLADDGEWFGFEVTVRGRNIVVRIDTTEVVCYTEPEHPYRTQAHARQLLGHGAIALRGVQGEVAFRNLAIERLRRAGPATRPTHCRPWTNAPTA